MILLTLSIQSVTTFTPLVQQPNGQELRDAPRSHLNEGASQQTATVPDVSDLDQAIGGLNEALKVLQTHLRFRLHEDTHRYYVEIVDTLEDEVIREVPPKRFLDMIADMYRFMGMMVDEKR